MAPQGVTVIGNDHASSGSGRIITTTVCVVVTASVLSPFLRRAIASFTCRIHMKLSLMLRTLSPTKKNDDDIKGKVCQLYVHPGMYSKDINFSFLSFRRGTITQCPLRLSFPASPPKVKSLRSVSIDCSVIDTKGFVNDRRWMMVYPAPVPLTGQFGSNDATHRFLSQRQCPILATVNASINETNNTITLSTTSNTPLPAGEQQPKKSVTFSMTNNNSKKYYRSALWSDIVTVQDMGDEPSQFIRNIIQYDREIPDEIKSSDIRLVVQADNDSRTTNDYFTPPSARLSILESNRNPSVALTDGFPILIASEASLQEVNRRLIEKGRPQIPMNRFRPNIVVKDNGRNHNNNKLKPFEEDYWKLIRIGGANGAILHVVKPCPRCKESCTDQQTGAVTKDPVTIMKEFRSLDSNSPENVYFAVNAIPDPNSIGLTINIDDEIEILQYNDNPIYTD